MSLTLQRVFKVHKHSVESKYDNIRPAHPECGAGMQYISETNAAATLGEGGHFED